MSEWQPISTATIKPFAADEWHRPATPNVLLTNGWWATVGSYQYTVKGKGRWIADGQVFLPTHWMAIPELPGAEHT